MGHCSAKMVHVLWYSFAYDNVDPMDETRFDDTLKWQTCWWEPRVVPFMKKAIKARKLPMGWPEEMEKARVMLREVCDEVEMRVSSNGGYLSGPTFGVYDLTFCALASFAVLP